MVHRVLRNSPQPHILPVHSCSLPVPERSRWFLAPPLSSLGGISVWEAVLEAHNEIHQSKVYLSPLCSLAVPTLCSSASFLSVKPSAPDSSTLQTETGHTQLCLLSEHLQVSQSSFLQPLLILWSSLMSIHVLTLLDSAVM